jgi:hypothetical protein
MTRRTRIPRDQRVKRKTSREALALRDLWNATADAISSNIKDVLPTENSAGARKLAEAYAAVIDKVPGPKPAGPGRIR